MEQQQLNNTSERAKAFERALSLITDDNVRNFCIGLLENADDYFFTEPASSSGKYHPTYALGEGGLMRHSMAAAIFLRHLLDCNMFKDGEDNFSEHEKNLLVCGAIVHDIKKYGMRNMGHTVKEHPEITAEYIRSSNYEKYWLTKDDIEFMASAVESHMGQWGNRMPETSSQKLLHLADYLASRKDLSVEFGTLPDIKFERKPLMEEINPGEYVMPFGKFKGTKISEVDPGYLNWLITGFSAPSHPAVKMAKKFIEREMVSKNVQ